MAKPDITINLPAEYVDILSEVLSIGIDRVKTDPATRRELRAWWQAEHEFIQEEIDKNE